MIDVFLGAFMMSINGILAILGFVTPFVLFGVIIYFLATFLEKRGL